jgi:hypothetical protein
MRAEPADEAPHAPGPEAEWSDVWHLDAATPDGVGLTVRLELYPNEQRAWYWTYLVLPTLPGPVVVRDHDVPLPRRSLTVRAEGLWAELWCETPLEHWTYGLEAFAVRLDDPADALTGEIGERLPVGLDLEWEVDGPIHVHRPDWSVRGYVETGSVHGEVLLGGERLELDAQGAYQRSWGRRERHDTGAWSIACAGAPLKSYVAGSADGLVDGFVECGARHRSTVTGARREAHAGAARIVLDDDIELEVDVLMDAPVPIDATTALGRSLCRFRVGDAAASGWSAVNVRRSDRLTP